MNEYVFTPEEREARERCLRLCAAATKSTAPERRDAKLGREFLRAVVDHAREFPERSPYLWSSWVDIRRGIESDLADAMEDAEEAALHLRMDAERIRRALDAR